MFVADVMSVNLVTVESDATVEEAVKLMLDYSISGLPVVTSSGALAGIVTEGDFLRRAETDTERRRPRWLEFLLGPGRLASEYVHSHGRKVSEVMTYEVHSLAENAPLEDVVDLMERFHVKRVPVLRDGKLVGLVCRSDLLRAFSKMAVVASAISVEDAAIRARLMDDLDKQAWVPRASINISVKDGAVEFSGVIFDDRERGALRTAAENVPGVKAIVDHLTWVEPQSGFVVAPDQEAPAHP